MRDAVASITVLGVVFMVCCLHVSVADESPLKSTSNDNPQIDYDMSKRDWNKDLHIWGKRAWNNLHDGWGRKRSVPQEQDKRAWQNLHSGWGKRFSPEDEDALRQLIAWIDRTESPQYDEYDNDLETNDDEKRNWGQFHGGWGKRSSKWDNFRGAWGKREPAWSNLKGIWGKRSQD